MEINNQCRKRNKNETDYSKSDGREESTLLTTTKIISDGRFPSFLIYHIDTALWSQHLRFVFKFNGQHVDVALKSDTFRFSKSIEFILCLILHDSFNKFRHL